MTVLPAAFRSSFTYLENKDYRYLHLTNKIILIMIFSRKYGIEIKDFGPSWRDGFAFSAMINNIDDGLIDMSKLPENPNRVNLENAFLTAETHLGIPKLLDPEGKFGYKLIKLLFLKHLILDLV